MTGFVLFASRSQSGGSKRKVKLKEGKKKNNEESDRALRGDARQTEKWDQGGKCKSNDQMTDK